MDINLVEKIKDGPFYLWARKGPFIKVEAIIGGIIFYKIRWGIKTTKCWETIKRFEKLYDELKVIKPDSNTWLID